MKQKNAIWLGVASLFAATAALFFIRNKNKAGEEKPPKRAPQLNIENPGTQDDFPKAPSESALG